MCTPELPKSYVRFESGGWSTSSTEAMLAMLSPTRSAKERRPAAPRGLQVEGGKDRPGPLPQWKMFSLLKIVEGIEVLPGAVTFHMGTNYGGSFDSIVASL